MGYHGQTWASKGLSLTGRRFVGARRSVSRVLSGLATGTTIPLGRASRHASRDQPGRRGGNAPAARAFVRPPAAPIRSCSRWGLPCHPRCRGCGALLPLRFTLARGELLPCAGGLFSVALSLGSPPPAVGRHRIPVEPGLSSAVTCGSGRPTVWQGSHGRERESRQRPSHICATASRRASVPPSAWPLTASPRQCRWKARSTVASAGSSGPSGATS